MDDVDVASTIEQSAAKPHSHEVRRIGTYGLVGVINTGIDFSILNALHFHAHWNLIASNLASTSAAMVFSFAANKRFVFKDRGKQKIARQAIVFWGVTASGLYGLQSIVIWLASHPLQRMANGMAGSIHSLIPLSTTFIVANGVKALATLASLVWNYVWYKKVVFNRE